MEHTKLVSPGLLDEYSDRLDSRPVIPELIAHLVTSSAPDLTKCRIPYGDSIGLPGFDGLVETDNGFRQYVPKMASIWEIGTGKDPQDKATDEFTKRTKQVPKEERITKTFVFVTPRSKAWDHLSQEAWLRTRQDQGWKDIKIIDGIQLCEWLREFPSLGKWFLQRTGVSSTSTGFQTPAEHWLNLEQLTSKDDPPLPDKLFLIGRDNACTQLERLFRQDVQQLIYLVENENDAEDFISAFLKASDRGASLTLGARCLFVSNADAWHTFSNLRTPHVLVASTRLDLADYNEQLHSAARANGHSVVFSVSGAWGQGNDKQIPLRSPSRSLIEKTLVDSGFSPSRAADLASAGTLNLSALKRHLLGLGAVPPYATWQNARILAQASLIGQWKGDNSADQNAIGLLLGKDYGEWIETARNEALHAGTPLLQKNESWKVISRGEAWDALGPRLTDKDLEQFAEMALRVLAEADPQFELPKEKRYMAQIEGKQLTHSRALREGLSESLALLGAKPSALSSASSGRAERTAKLVVRKLLHNASWLQWASLNHEMPLLAEAAPEEFLDALELSLQDLSASPFRQVFQQEGSGGMFGGWNYITGVLWGLETLAWHPDYLSRATLLLGELAAIDPGGTWSNRPKNSLVDIYLPWHSQTVADLSVRKLALESLLKEQPEVGWNVLLSLIPSFHGSTSGTRKPTWRPLLPRDWVEVTTHAEYWKQVQVYAGLCVKQADGNTDRMAQLIDRLSDIPDPAHSEILNYLKSRAVTTLSEENRARLWEALRDLTEKHRKFSDAQWALPSDRVAQIELVAAALKPSSRRLVYRRLFSERDSDFYEPKMDYKLQQEKLNITRQDAINDILKNDGMEGVLTFAHTVDSPHKVGDTLGEILDSSIDAFILPRLLHNDDQKMGRLVRTFIWRRFLKCGWTWAEQQLNIGWDRPDVLRFLTTIPFEKGTWERAESILGAEADQFWQHAEVSPWGLEPDGMLDVAQKLKANRRADAALDCLYVLAHHKIPIPMPLAHSVLIEALQKNDPPGLNQDHALDVIKWLQDCNDADSDELAHIEWLYLPLLNRLSGAEPKALEHRLASSPEFYQEVIAHIFRSDKDDDDTKPEPSEAQQQIAKNAYSLLHEWRTLPGTLPENQFDGELIQNWLNKVRELCSESGHVRIAMDQLGQALAHAPPDPGGLWIHRSIALALNERTSKAMRDGFIVGLFNRRGVYSFSHGEEESRIAGDYRAKARSLLESGFPRIADAVRNLAEDYERTAERESQRDPFGNS